MLLFAANDPGSQNHIKPIYLRAVADGVEAEIIDLMSAPEFAVDARAIELIEQRRPSLLVSGSSSNQEEKALVQACKAKGNATLSVVDFAVGRKLKGREPDNLSDRFLVTNQFAANELLDLGVDSERVILAGSTHLEQVFLAGFDQPAESIISHYGIEPGKAVVSFFCAANQANSVRAVASLADNLAGMPIESAQVIIKPHPRMLDKQKLKEICERVDQFIYDSEGTTSTASILAASNLSLSIASTVSLESIGILSDWIG